MKLDITGVQSSRLRSLIGYWTNKRCDRPMPARGDLDPIEIPSLLPIVLLADVVDAQARIRLLGTETTAAYGAECRGHLLEDMDLGDFTSLSTKLLAVVLSSREPASAAGAFINRSELNRIEMVLTPLSSDGETVNHIFGGLIIKPISRTSPITRQTPVTYISKAQDRTTGIFPTGQAFTCYNGAD